MPGSAVAVETGGDPQQKQQDEEGGATGHQRTEALVVATTLLALGGEGDQLGSGAVEAHLRQNLSGEGGIKMSAHRKRAAQERSRRLRRWGTLAPPQSSFRLYPRSRNH